MFWYLLVTTALACTSAAPTTETTDMYVVPNDTATCAKDLIKWCDGMKYPQEGVGMSMVSLSMHLPEEGYIRVLCTSNMDGTNCTKNGQPWFACSKDNEFSYKGKKLDPEDLSSEDGLCDTAERAFNDIMVQNLSFTNNSISRTLESAMEGFFEQMAGLREMIEVMSRRISRAFDGGYPAFGGWVGGRDEEYPEDRKSDQIERE